MEKVMQAVGMGSPPSDAVMAKVALERGEVLWRLGRPEDALRVLRAGVPPQHRPRRPRVSVAKAGRLRAPPLRWTENVLIGHYRRLLYLAARLLWAAGAESEARAHLRVAAAAGLPEAQVWTTNR